MLLVETYLDKSPIHGIGLFAKEKILKDTKIYEVDDILTRIFIEDENNKILDFDGNEVRDEKVIEFLNHYTWKKRYKDSTIYYLSLDNDRFTNHSDNPNVYETNEETFALRDIEIGEEILTDYSKLEENLD